MCGCVVCKQACIWCQFWWIFHTYCCCVVAGKYVFNMMCGWARTAFTDIFAYVPPSLCCLAHSDHRHPPWVYPINATQETRIPRTNLYTCWEIKKATKYAHELAYIFAIHAYSSARGRTHTGRNTWRQIPTCTYYIWARARCRRVMKKCKINECIGARKCAKQRERAHCSVLYPTHISIINNTQKVQADFMLFFFFFSCCVQKWWWNTFGQFTGNKKKNNKTRILCTYAYE